MARRRKVHEEHENNERWLVSYADFITLLFAFFTVLYATSAADLKKQEEFQESIQKNFEGYTGWGASERMDEFTDSNANSLVKPPIDLFPPMGAGAQEVQQHVERKLDKELSESDKKDSLVGVKHDVVGVSIQLAANKLFNSGSAELSNESASALEQIGKLLKESNRRLIIEGHTDDMPIKSEKYPSNWELSAARATKIVRYLAARHKIPPGRMAAVAYADQKPMVPNTSEESRARNRRIEIKIVTGNAAL